jgi:hypothetical protein
MQKLLQRISSFFIRSDPPQRRKGRKTRAQSLVEVAIAFPLLLMLFSGMVEFGFMLNTYLSLLDATRQTARFLANRNPFTSINENTSPATFVDDPAFYDTGAGMIIDILDPPDDAKARSIVFDPSRDDIIISVLRVSVNEQTHTVAEIKRFPQALNPPYFRVYGNQESAYSDNARIIAAMTRNGTPPVRTGMLIVEICYGYEGVLKLPWVQAFMPGNYVLLRANTIMPLVSAKPPKIPTPTP